MNDTSTIDQAAAEHNARLAKLVAQTHDNLYRLSGEPEFAELAASNALWTVIWTLERMNLTDRS